MTKSLMWAPLGHAGAAQAECERAMLASADRVLAPRGMPAEVEGDLLAFWKMV
jgi:hypothetical protein